MNSTAAYWSSPTIWTAAAWCFVAFLLTTVASKSTSGPSTWSSSYETLRWIPLKISSFSLHNRFFGE